jgi:hypothetical protein
MVIYNFDDADPRSYIYEQKGVLFLLGYLCDARVFGILENLVFLVVVDILESVHQSVEFRNLRDFHLQVLENQLVVFIRSAAGYEQFFHSRKMGFYEFNHFFDLVGKKLIETDQGVFVYQDLKLAGVYFGVSRSWGSREKRLFG